MSTLIEGILNGIVSAQKLVGEADRHARAERRAAEFTNCPACQSGLVLFIKDTPHADDAAIQAVMETLWETCPICTAGYDAHTAKDKCPHGHALETSLETCETCLDAWADANAPEPDMRDMSSRWEKENIHV